MSGTWYANRRAQGLCLKCSAPSKGARCGPCQAVQNEKMEALRQGRKASGVCIQCGNVRGESKVYCTKCLVRVRLQTRERGGWGSWVKGGRGRPPLSA